MSRPSILNERHLSLGKGILWGGRTIASWAALNLGRRLRKKPPLPSVLTVYVTYRCNLRCRICGIWKQPPDEAHPDLSLDGLETIIADPFFRRVRMINLNGGEPNLRPDLPGIAAMLIRRLPRLRALSVNSNGLPPETTLRNARTIAGLCREKGIRFSVSLSLHGTGRLFDDIVGLPGAYENVMASFSGLKALRRDDPIHLSANCVMTGLNLSELDEMPAWSEREGIPVNFTLGEVRERFNNLDMASAVLTEGDRRKKMVAFLRSLASRKRVYRQHSLRYARLAEMLERDAPRALSCHYFMGGAILGADGHLYYCKKCPSLGNVLERSAREIYFDPENIAFRKNGLEKSICPSCPPNTFNQMEASRDLHKILAFLLFSRR
ncbi:MAG: radical SAM protein [Candidatus Aminicenantes bacterium]|nr:radical SAM protein [Candidatus Aminicenantes bacterium]